MRLQYHVVYWRVKQVESSHLPSHTNQKQNTHDNLHANFVWGQMTRFYLFDSRIHVSRQKYMTFWLRWKRAYTKFACKLSCAFCFSICTFSPKSECHMSLSRHVNWTSECIYVHAHVDPFRLFPVQLTDPFRSIQTFNWRV